jgi:hypothetical protein
MQQKIKNPLVLQFTNHPMVDVGVAVRDITRDRTCFN